MIPSIVIATLASPGWCAFRLFSLCGVRTLNGCFIACEWPISRFWEQAVEQVCLIKWPPSVLVYCWPFFRFLVDTCRFNPHWLFMNFSSGDKKKIIIIYIYTCCLSFMTVFQYLNPGWEPNCLKLVTRSVFFLFFLFNCLWLCSVCSF